jgi:hypothetical protein
MTSSQGGLKDRGRFYLAERAVNPQFDPARGQAPEFGMGLAGGGGFADLESPLPQARLDQQNRKLDTFA